MLLLLLLGVAACYNYPLELLLQQQQVLLGVG
jgi:hypothetical protein